MHTGINSFADRIVHNIKTNETKDLVLEQLYTLYNIKIIVHLIRLLGEHLNILQVSICVSIFSK
jgi:hypothetical protein